MSSGGYSGISNSKSGAQELLEQMYSQLAAIANEERLASSVLISNKFNDVQQGREYNYTQYNNRLFIEKGIHSANFVIDSDGILHIGNGHSYLARKASVQAAGTLKVNSSGVLRHINNLSGHYQPSVTETVRYLQMMYAKGYISNKTWVDIYSFDKSKSGYITKIKVFYSGPYQYLHRRLSK